MKKILFSLLVLLMAFSSQAQDGLGANQRVIGHTVSDEYDYSGVMFGTAGTYTVGALLYPSQLSFYKGCKVVGMRVAAALDLGRTKVFVQDIEKADPLFSQNQKLYQGWNNIFFNGDPYTIKGDETLFYGFDYVETDEMIENEAGGLVCMQNATQGGFVIEQNGQLYQASGVGCLCVQLIVDITSLPADNMTISVMDSGFKYKKRSEELDIFFMMMNVGKDAINNYTVSIAIDDNEPQTFLVEEEKPVDAGATTTWEKYLPIPKDLPVGMHTITGKIVDINGNPAPDPQKTTRQTTFALYDNSLDREKVLVEIYSNQTNAYSAELDEVMDDVSSTMAKKAVFVQVHAPNTALSIPDAAWISNTYAYTYPSFTINRAYFPGEAHIAYDMNDYLGFLPPEFLVGMVEEMIDQDYYNPAFASIELTGKYDEPTRKLDLTVSGKALEEAKAIYGDMAVTLMVVEDEVRSRQVVISGQSTKPDFTYEHDNVLQGFVTSPYGDKITVENDEYSVKYSYTVSEEMDPEKVRVIAFLTKAGAKAGFTEEQAQEYDVINATEYIIGELSAVSEVEMDSNKEIEAIYSLDGIRLDKESLKSPGFKIIRYTDGTSAKVIVK